MTKMMIFSVTWAGHHFFESCSSTARQLPYINFC